MKKIVWLVLLAALGAGLAFWAGGKKNGLLDNPADVESLTKPAAAETMVGSVVNVPPDASGPGASPPVAGLALWPAGASLEEKDAQAARLVEADTAEAVALLMQGIAAEKDWETRAVLSRNLRALGNPEALQVLLPALLVDYGRGSPATVEIIDTIGRLAQPDTVWALEALHWQATGGVESMKVVRAMAAIRNPPARRALNKLAQTPTVTESLRLAAQEAAQVIPP